MGNAAPVAAKAQQRLTEIRLRLSPATVQDIVVPTVDLPSPPRAAPISSNDAVELLSVSDQRSSNVLTWL